MNKKRQQEQHRDKKRRRTGRQEQQRRRQRLQQKQRQGQRLRERKKIVSFDGRLSPYPSPKRLDYWSHALATSKNERTAHI